jgi:hypothetical protein
VARTIFQYTKDQDGKPIFFRSNVRANFARGPVVDNTSRPVYFTGGPAPRPSYTMLPSSTAGGGDLPQEFFTLGLPRPAAPLSLSDTSAIEAVTASVDPPLYIKPAGKETYSALANTSYTWPIGTFSGNGIDDVLVYVNCGIQHKMESEQFDEDELNITIELLVDGTSVSQATLITSFSDQGNNDHLRRKVFAGSLRAPRATGNKTYALKFTTSISGGGESADLDIMTRTIYMLDIRAYHEDTTIRLEEGADFSYLTAGDLVDVSSVGATFRSQSTNAYGGSASVSGIGFSQGYSLGDQGILEDQTERSVNGSKRVVRASAGVIVLDEAWPWNLTSGGAGGTISFSGSSGAGDASSLQDIGYVVTFLTTVGQHIQEGPPSMMSPLLSTRPGLPITVSGLPTGTTEEGNFRFSGKRLYRTNVTSDGIGILQFVAELPMDQTSFIDTVRAVDLGEELLTDTWIMPPSDMFGLVACHNGMLAGISGNLVCVSVPFQPHAYPVDTIVVLTKGRPSVIYGAEPESMRVAPIESPYPCLNPHGVVTIGEAAIYPSTVGLVYLPVRGAARIITEGLLEREEWARYNPETIIATEHHGKYLGFYEDEEGDVRSFLLDPRSRVSSWTDLDLEADACCTDEQTGNAMFMEPGSNDVYLFDPVTGDQMEFRWRSKTFTTQRPWCPGYARVLAEQYPVTYRLYANKQQPGPFIGGGDNTESEMVLIHERSVTDSRPFALPGNYLANAFEIETSGSPAAPAASSIVGVGMASSVEELLRD